MAELTVKANERIADIRDDYSKVIDEGNTKTGRKEIRKDKYGNKVEIEWIDDVSDGSSSVHVVFY